MSSRDSVIVPLHRIAHARAGDKGDRLNVAVFPYRAEHFELLVAAVTEDAVARQFAHRRPTAVKRYVLPGIQALNFVIDGVLEGGVNSSLCIDRHGKALSFLLLELAITLPGEIAAQIATHERRPQ